MTKPSTTDHFRPGSVLAPAAASLPLRNAPQRFRVVRYPRCDREGMRAMSKIHLQGDDARYLALVGRQLFSVIFIIASAGHFTQGTIALAAEHGVPMAGLLVPVSGLIALAGGLSVLFGYRARVGGALLVV